MNAVCPYIAPDGRYLLFSASPSAAASLDLFVTFRLDTGKWAPAQALNAPINSAGMEMCPMVSADGDYLFFIRWHQRVHGIYWVSTRSFRKLSPKK